MRKFDYILFFIVLLASTNVIKVKAQTGIVVYSQDTLCFNTNNLTCISHEMIIRILVLFNWVDLPRWPRSCTFAEK